MRKRLELKDKKGDLPSFFYLIAAIVVVGIILFVFAHLFGSIFGELDSWLDENQELNNTEAHQALNTYQGSTERIWDYAFLGIAFAYVIALALTAFATRISPVFYFIYAIVSIIGLFISVVLSNTWQEIANNPEFATTLANFPITNALLGSFYPTFIVGVLVIFLILLFGKPTGGNA